MALAGLTLHDKNSSLIYDIGSKATQSIIYHLKYDNHLCLCAYKKNTALSSVPRDKYSTQLCLIYIISRHAPHIVFSVHTHGSALCKCFRYMLIFNYSKSLHICLGHHEYFSQMCFTVSA